MRNLCVGYDHKLDGNVGQMLNDWVLGSFLHQGKQKYWLPGDSVNIMLGAICVAKAKIVKKQYVTVDCLVTPCNVFGILHKTQTIY